MLAAKFFDDHYYNNAYYAKVGGVTCDEMNSLEVEFLFMLNFHLFVSTRTYKMYYQELCVHASNPKSTCGCRSTQVPVLILPFPLDDGKAFTTREEKSTVLEEHHPQDLVIETEDDMEGVGVARDVDLIESVEVSRHPTTIRTHVLKFQISDQKPGYKTLVREQSDWQSPFKDTQDTQDTDVDFHSQPIVQLKDKLGDEVMMDSPGTHSHQSTWLPQDTEIQYKSGTRENREDRGLMMTRKNPRELFRFTPRSLGDSIPPESGSVSRGSTRRWSSRQQSVQVR